MKKISIFINNVENLDPSISRIYITAKNFPRRFIHEGRFFSIPNCPKALASMNTCDLYSGGNFYFPGENDYRESVKNLQEKTFDLHFSSLYKKNEEVMLFDLIRRFNIESEKIFTVFGVKQLEFNFEEEKEIKNFEYELVKTKGSRTARPGIRFTLLKKFYEGNYPNCNIVIKDKSFHFYAGNRAEIRLDNTIFVATGEHRLHFSSEEDRDNFYIPLKKALAEACAKKLDLPTKDNLSFFNQDLVRLYKYLKR